MPHAMLQGAFDGALPAGDQWYWRADFVNEIPDEAVAHPRDVRRRAADVEVDHAHVPDRRRRARRGPGDTAVELPRRELGLGVRRRRSRSGERAAIRNWTIDYQEALHPFSSGGAYVNMMMDEGEERVRPAIATTTTGWPQSRRPTTRPTCSASTRTSSRQREPRDRRRPVGSRAVVERAGDRRLARAEVGPALDVRPLRHGDVRTVMSVFKRLSERSRRARFNGPKPCLNRSELRQLASIDRNRYALVGYVDGDEQPVAIARLVRDGDTAEIAFAVADAYQQRGIGSALGVGDSSRMRALPASRRSRRS